MVDRQGRENELGIVALTMMSESDELVNRLFHLTTAPSSVCLSVYPRSRWLILYNRGEDSYDRSVRARARAERKPFLPPDVYT